MKPVVLAPILGTVYSMAELPLPTVAAISVRLLGQAAGGMALFVTGLILSAQRFRLTWNTAWATVTVNILQPLVAFAIARVIGAPPDITKITVLLAALPSGFFGLLFGSNYSVNSEEASSTVIASTVAAMLTLAVAIALLYG
jgi:malonate transporter